ncbi:DUF2268 domain-containing putative Zn-dependent protease [Dyella sp.]|uniref:DUF2268 domain-containing putative Zn-dependent protease n=1 Tax=Dyella sp. TaxID=1869338 RepID=UPI003F81A83A
MRLWILAAFLITFFTAPTHAAAVPPHQPAVQYDDVTRFYAVFDETGGHPTAAALKSGYLDPGTAGLRAFVHARIGSAQQLADAIEKSAPDFAGARRCLPMLPAARDRLRAVFTRLAALDPEASFPPVTFVIGRDNTGGTTTAEGVTIGLEVICRSNWLDPDIVQRLVHLIAHEYVHVQQPAAQIDPPPGATLLFQSLVEGGAEFIGELTSGEVLNRHLQRWTQGKACRIERDFAAHAMGSDVSAWLYNGPGTSDPPGDLGYWVGYRIVRAYYRNSHNKAQAIQDILHVDNANAATFLARSGWRADDDCGSTDTPAPSAAPLH